MIKYKRHCLKKGPRLYSILICALIGFSGQSITAQTQECNSCAGGGTILGGNDCTTSFTSNPVSAPVQLNDANYQLVLQDDFNGSSLDLSKWNGGGWIADDPAYYYTVDSSLLTCYSLSNVSVSGGYAHLMTTYTPNQQCFNQDTYDTAAVRQYTCGVIDSDWGFTSGKFEIRAKIPYPVSQWPSFWLYAFSEDNFWEPMPTQEIDMFEIKPDATESDCTEDCDIFSYPAEAGKRMMMTSHYKPIGSSDDCPNQMCYVHGDYLHADFHTYTLVWTADVINWYLDGTLLHSLTRTFHYSQDPSNVNRIRNEFPDPKIRMRIKLGNQVFQEPTVIYANDNTCYNTYDYLPSDFQIDYVKVWKKTCGESLNLCSTGKTANQTYFSGNITINNSCPEWVVNNGEYEKMLADNSVSLTNFHAVAGSKFRAKAYGCDLNVPERMMESQVVVPPAIASELSKAKEDEQNDQRSSDVKIIPNPSSGQFSVVFVSDISQESQILIHDLTGRLVYNSVINASGGTNKIDFAPENLGPGVYFLRIEGISGAQPLVIQKQ